MRKVKPRALTELSRVRLNLSFFLLSPCWLLSYYSSILYPPTHPFFHPSSLLSARLLAYLEILLSLSSSGTTGAHCCPRAVSPSLTLTAILLWVFSSLFQDTLHPATWSVPALFDISFITTIENSIGASWSLLHLDVRKEGTSSSFYLGFPFFYYCFSLSVMSWTRGHTHARWVISWPLNTSFTDLGHWFTLSFVVQGWLAYLCVDGIPKHKSMVSNVRQTPSSTSTGRDKRSSPP